MKPHLQTSLIGHHVELLPLEQIYAAELLSAAMHQQIWQWLPHEPFSQLEDVQNWIADALFHSNQQAFVIKHKKFKQVVGSTRLMDIQPNNKSLEIGWTWINPSYWRTAVNSECKLLLMQYVFEELKYNRVQFKTDSRNIRSQKAIERLGAKKEGVLRSNMLLPDGYRRDSVYYSVLIEEWPEVKARLETVIKKTSYV